MIKLFTHVDLDGIGCAILAKIAFAQKHVYDTVEIEYCERGNDINEKVRKFLNEDIHCQNYNRVFITDLSVSDELAKEIDEHYDNFYLLDHHPTALSLNKYNWGKVQVKNEIKNINTSGTELYYNWLIDNHYLYNSEVLNRFVELVRDYDTWRWAELGENGIICKKVNDLLHLYGIEKFTTWCVSEIHDCVFPRLYAADELILNIKQSEIDAYIEEKDAQMIVFDIAGYNCGIVFAEQYFSELGNKLCKMHPEIDFVAMIDMGNKDISYRTIKEDINLGQGIAAILGGGGHPKAAGSPIPNKFQIDVIKTLFQL